jgi:hypothetical protein
MLLDFLDHFVRLPRVTSPDFADFAVFVDQCGGEAVRNGAAFGLPVNGKGARKRIDFIFLAGGKRPDLRISMMKCAVVI